MTSRERFLRAVDHKDLDRLPRDFVSEGPVAESLIKALNLADINALKDKFKVDLEYVRVQIRCPYDDGRNIWGMKYSSAGLTENVSLHPLADATTVEDVDAHPWPSPDWADIDAFKAEAEIARNTGRAVSGSTWGSIFGEAYRLMGMDNFMMGLVLYPDVVHRIIEHLTNFFLEVDRRIFESCKGLIDITYHGNDFGTQRGLLFSREMWFDFYSAPLKKLFDQSHAYGLRPMFHSCGAVSELIDDLVGIGVEILDPVQNTAEGMNPKILKDKYGDKVAFHGCVSAQKVLPLGTPDEVREHVKEICDVMKPGSGYIFSSDQAITQDTPTENVIAMYEAVEEYGNY